MDIEVLLFLAVGGLSIFAAVMMLLDDNAVQSALFLILNFACVAFLYLMLDAAFLAMVQIAVYAGAIMVLFIFVIMLLGAEKTTSGTTRQFKWLAPLVLTLSFSLFIPVYLAVNQGDVEDRELTPSAPLVRAVHAAGNFVSSTDVVLTSTDGSTQHTIEDVTYKEVDRDGSDLFIEVEPGTYDVAVSIPDERFTAPFPVGSVVVEAGNNYNIVLYGASSNLEIGEEATARTIGIPVVTSFAEDLSPIENREGRLTVFNAYAPFESLTLVDPGADFNVTAEEEVETYVEALPYGEASEMQVLPFGELRGAFVEPGNQDNVIFRLRDFEVPRESSAVVFISSEGGADEGTVATAAVAITEARPTFGSPQAIGQELFTRYVLPFEMVAVLLLAAMVGAIIITQRADIKPKPGRPTRRKVSRPLTNVISSQTGHSLRGDRPELTEPRLDDPEPAGD